MPLMTIPEKPRIRLVQAREGAARVSRDRGAGEGDLPGAGTKPALRVDADQDMARSEKPAMCKMGSVLASWDTTAKCWALTGV